MRHSSNSTTRLSGWVLVLLGLGAVLVYAAALARFPLLAIYAQPIQNLEKLTNADPWAGLVLAGWTLLLFAGYALGAAALLWEIRRGEEASGRDGEMAHRSSFRPDDRSADWFPTGIPWSAGAGLPYHLGRSVRLYVPRAHAGVLPGEHLRQGADRLQGRPAVLVCRLAQGGDRVRAAVGGHELADRAAGRRAAGPAAVGPGCAVSGAAALDAGL